MTSSKKKNKKRSTKNNKQEQEDDYDFGPKIRHPVGTIYLSQSLFTKDKTDSTKLGGFTRLYRDIIRYPLDGGEALRVEQEGFRTRRIGRWLLKNNPDYIEHYKGMDSHITRKLPNIEKRLKKYLGNLERFGIIEIRRYEESKTENGKNTPLYGYTSPGLVIAMAVDYKKSIDDVQRQFEKDKIYNLIQRMRRLYNSVTFDFIAKMYEKMREYDMNQGTHFFDTFMSNLISALENVDLHFDHIIEYISHALGFSPELFRTAIEEITEDDRKTIILIEKDTIENRFLMNQPPRSWTKAWMENRKYADKLVLYAVCQNDSCLHHYPYVVDYYAYRFDNYLVTRQTCIKCQTKDSVRIHDSFKGLKGLKPWF